MFIVIVLVATSVMAFGLLVVIILALLKFKQKVANASVDEELKVMYLEVAKEEGSIGEGPSATVYRAVTVGRKMVAVKRLKEKNAETSDLEERILFRVTDHPHVVTF